MATLSFDAYRKIAPAIRCFQHYTPDQRADLMASHRLGYRQREATGHFFYVSPCANSIAGRTRAQADEAGYRNFVSAFEEFSAEVLRRHNGGPALAEAA